MMRVIVIRVMDIFIGTVARIPVHLYARRIHARKAQGSCTGMRIPLPLVVGTSKPHAEIYDCADPLKNTNFLRSNTSNELRRHTVYQPSVGTSMYR